MSLKLLPVGPVYNYTIGDTIDIGCEVDCSCIDATVMWTDINGRKEFVAGLQDTQYDELQGASLIASNATTEMSGTYICTAVINSASTEPLIHTINIAIRVQ